MIRLLGTLVAVAVIAGLGFGSYYGVRSLAGEGGAEAQRPTVDEIDAAIDADRAKPRLTNELINGIRVGTEAEQAGGYCDRKTAPPQYTDPAKAVGTDIEIAPGYLPDGAKEGNVEAVECGGVLVTVFKTYSLPDLRTIDIGRSRVAPNVERSWALYGAAERISPVVVQGKTGVLEEPVVPGFDATTFVLNETFGFTLVRADLPVEETLKIAESIR
jgi:hypothetical protein